MTTFLARLLSPLALLCAASSVRALQGTVPSVPIECGAVVDSGDLLPGAEKTFSFLADPGDLIKLFGPESFGAGSVRMEFFDPLGGFLYIDWRHGLSPSISGQYTVKLTNTGTSSGSLRFQLVWLVPDSKHCGKKLECGSSEFGAASHPFPAVYNFIGETGDQVACTLTPVTNATRVKRDLYGPDGRLVGGTVWNQTPLTMEGEYTVLVFDGEDTVRDDYCTFHIDLDWALPASKSCGQRLACGDFVSGEILSNWDNDVYSFLGNHGDLFHLEIVRRDDGEAGFYPLVYVYDPNGTYIYTTGLSRVF